MNKSIIFCQAPIEVPNVISLYEELSLKGDNITIVSLRTNSYKAFFQYHYFKADYIFLESIPIKINFLFSYFSIKRKIAENISLLQIEGADIYFTSRFDYQLSLYFKYLKRGKKLVYNEGKDNIWVSDKKFKVSLRNRIKFFLMRIYSSVLINNFKNGDNKFLPEILLDHHKELEHRFFKGEKDILNRFSYNVKKSNKERFIFFTEPYRNKFQKKENYDNINIDIVNFLKGKEKYIVMKGHPRLGHHRAIEDKVDEIIPEFIPSEFICYNDFSKAIGFVTTALCDSSNYIPSYSLLHICEVVDETEFNYWNDFLNRMSNNKVHYITKYEDLIFSDIQ